MATAPNLTHRPVEQAADPAKLAELAGLIRDIREQVESRKPRWQPPAEVLQVDFSALIAARDAAWQLTQTIGQVNPRPAGLVNGTIQFAKRAIARSLQWFVRDQLQFNHEVIRALNHTIESLGETNTALRASAEAAHKETEEWARQLQAGAARLEQASNEYRASLERRQIQFESAFDAQLKAGLAEQAKSLEAVVWDSGAQLQDLLWRELQKIWDSFASVRREYETLIHSELRLARQRAALPELPAPPTSNGASSHALAIDWLAFANKFRGSEEYVRQTATIYPDRFRGHAPVVDIGCGRGEALDLFRQAGLAATGVEASAELAALCRANGHQVECADGFAYLEAMAPGSLGGILCAQMLEHVSPADVIRFIHLAHRALRPGGLLALETPNPECLAIFATHFYLDPSHTRPIPPDLMTFHMEEAGFGQVRVERLRPAVDSFPSLATLPAPFRDEFFGALDYAAFGYKL